jgi:hypothetical protein
MNHYPCHRRPLLMPLRLAGVLVGAALLLIANQARAVINAGLQPYDLFQSRYDRVIVLQIKTVDLAASTVRCQVLKTLKGVVETNAIVTLQFDPTLTEVLAGAVQDGDIQPGDPVAVFAGRRRSSREFMLYANSFYLGSVTGPGEWKIDKTTQNMVGEDGEQINTLAGTWNGATAQLVNLLEDIAAGRDHFPRKAYVRFREDLLLDRLDGPVEAIAVFDIEGDGDEDIIVCSRKGDRIYVQTDPMIFLNATTNLGLTSASGSVALADVNGDGLNDLLAGAVLHLGRFADNRFRFEKTDFLPEDLTTDLKTATFVELDGDGFPDVVASVIGRGLRAFKNPGTNGGPFVEITQTLGLDRPECGSTADGFVTPGDWNNDGRTDLFLAAGPGYLLVQNARGSFDPLPHGIGFKFTSGPGEKPGLTGAGVFMPLIHPDRMDLVVPLEDGWLLAANEKGVPVDITRWGNEISEGSNDHLSTIAEDFNLDGHLDLFTVSQTDNGHNRYIINRGYGSFMLAPVHKHYEHVFKGPAMERGGRAAAAGDLDDDGTPDLVLGNAHGEVVLILNDTLAVRKPIEHPPREIATLENTRLLQVRVMGSKGLVNARVQLFDASGRMVGRRDLGQNVSGGSWGPNRLTFAVRQPGVCRLQVRFADGLERTQAVDLTKQARVTVDVDRGEKSKIDAW